MKTINIITTVNTELDPDILRNYYEFEEGVVIYDLPDSELEALFLEVPIEDMMNNAIAYNYYTQIQKNP